MLVTALVAWVFTVATILCVAAAGETRAPANARRSARVDRYRRQLILTRHRPELRLTRRRAEGR